MSNSFLETHIRELLSSDRILNLDCVSIYDVFCLSRKIINEEMTFERSIKARIDYKLKSINNDYYVVIYDMDYRTYECRIAVVKPYKHWDDSKEKFYFKKNGNDVYISKRDGNHLVGDEILGIVGDEISELYDYQLKLSYKENNSTSYKKKCVNSDFVVDMGYYGVTISSGTAFEIKMYSWLNSINYECNSANIMQLLKENEDELYRKIFVKISDCPKWMQEELYEIRRQQVIEEEKERQKKLKKQKRREFWKKIFPLIK